MIKTGNNIYWLKERKYKVNYVTIPIGLKLKTKEIGYLTYFGEFGGNIGIPYKTREHLQIWVNFNPPLEFPPLVPIR